jgi:hypothetical protein
MSEVEPGEQVMLAREAQAAAYPPRACERVGRTPLREPAQRVSAVEFTHLECDALQGPQLFVAPWRNPMVGDPASELGAAHIRVDRETPEASRIHGQATGRRAWRMRL